ncbi:MAG: polyprenyl synthetase family protein [Methylophilaceae bacterium]
MKTISKKNLTLDDYMEDHLQKVNDVIRSSLDSEVPLINQVGKHIIDGGGKKMRPQCLLNLAGLAGGIKDIHYQLAAIVEFIHTATLLHDDVVDGSDTRRSSPTANVKFGNSASILVGDFIYSRSFQMMVELDNIEIMDILAYTTNKIAEGEVLQLINKNNFDISQENYFKVIQAKTGVLFEACGKLASIGNECSFNQKNSLSTIGEIFGQIYQLIDDMLDYSGDAAKIGKNLGDDLKDGKMTLPLIFAAEKANINDREIIKNSINHGDLSQLTKIISIINKTNAIESVKEVINTKYAELDHKISNFKDSAYKDQIMQFISKSIHRDF